LSNLQARLEPHAELVQAYHIPTTRVHRTYLARVRQRLVEHQRGLLQSYLELERQDGAKDEQETNKSTSAEAPSAPATVDDESKKRKREESTT